MGWLGELLGWMWNWWRCCSTVKPGSFCWCSTRAGHRGAWLGCLGIPCWWWYLSFLGEAEISPRWSGWLLKPWLPRMCIWGLVVWLFVVLYMVCSSLFRIWISTTWKPERWDVGSSEMSMLPTGTSCASSPAYLGAEHFVPWGEALMVFFVFFVKKKFVCQT